MAAHKRRPLAKRLSRFMKRRARPALNRFLVRYSEVGDPVVFDNGLFPFTKTLEDNYDEIRREALRLGELHDCLPTFHEVSPYQKRISHGDSWKTVWLYGFGHHSAVAQQLCPATTRLLRDVPELQSAVFSMLATGTHIPAHRGVYKGLINYHLGVIIPKLAKKCRMKVGNEWIVWQERQSYVFDDTNTHEVWNDSGEERVVLMLQVHRPLRAPGRQLSQLFLRALRLTPYLRKPRKNVRQCDARLREVAKERGLLPPRGADAVQGGETT
jgi:aspartyl/asparaginyl beta-hydroxylase (cupin superfamily)